MQLSDNEKRDIIKYLEVNKPLPEKYRFLLFEDKREVELVWNGKTNEVTNVVLPFQVIEQVDEPREEKEVKLQQSLFDTRGRQLQGWTNKLIWGDNKLILSSLKNGPLREEIEEQGGIKLIYIDPPFDVGADFSMDTEIGDEQFTKQPTVLEELAYRDTWGKGADSFVSMIYERLLLMRDLLSSDGTIYVHCDYRVSSYIRLALDEIFEKESFVNEIIWKRSTNTSSIGKIYKRAHDTVMCYSKSANYTFNFQRKSLSDASLKIYSKEDERGNYRLVPLLVSGRRSGQTGQPWRGIDPNNRGKNGMHWVTTHPKLDQYDKAGLIVWPNNENGAPNLKYYLDDNPGVVLSDLWDDISSVAASRKESVDYPTQKPEELLKRIIKTSSNEGDLVADFFCGSGTTLAVAEKLGRKWLGSDLGKFAVHTARKRRIDVQRQLKKEGKDYRAFEILNLGKYERQHYIGVNPNLRDEEKQQQLAQKEKNFVSLILSAYKAEEVDGFKTFYGKKGTRLVAIGPIDLPLSRLFVEKVIDECLKKSITKVDILAFEFEMGLFPNIQEEARSKGIDLALKYIPRDVFDKRAVEKNQVVFHDVSYVEVKPIVKKQSVTVELSDYCVYYNQDLKEQIEQTLKNGSSKVYVQTGVIYKMSKDKDGIVKNEVLTKKWTDWIDYWAADFNFESKREIVRVKDEQTGEFKEEWTGDYIFENEWQSFRTKKNKTLELTSIARELPEGKHKIAVKVVDIFGNDTMKVIKVTI